MQLLPSKPVLRDGHREAHSSWADYHPGRRQTEGLASSMGEMLQLWMGQGHLKTRGTHRKKWRKSNS